MEILDLLRLWIGGHPLLGLAGSLAVGLVVGLWLRGLASKPKKD